MNSHKELRPEQIKDIFQRAASAEVAPEVSRMIQAAQTPVLNSRLWMLPIVLGVAAVVAALIAYVPWKETSISKTSLQPIAYPSPTENKDQPGAGLTPLSKDDLIKKAEAAALQKHWADAEKFASAAGDSKRADLYFAEGNAQEFLTLCEDAVFGTKSDDIFTYCYEALKESRETNTYKEKTALLNKSRAIYKEATLAEVKVLLDKAEATLNSKTTDVKMLVNAKSQHSIAKDKLDNIKKFSGEDADTKAAEERANSFLDKIRSVHIECPDCASVGKVCNIDKGVCEAKPMECPAECANGCKPKTNICKPDVYTCSAGYNADGTCREAHVAPLKCELACLHGCNPDGTCSEAPPSNGKTREELANELRSVLALPEGCGRAGELLEELKKAGGTADYYYYKGYCAGDINPEKACDFYNRFLKIAKADTRAAQAKQFINGQDPSSYPTCVLP